MKYTNWILGFVTGIFLASIVWLNPTKASPVYPLPVLTECEPNWPTATPGYTCEHGYMDLDCEYLCTIEFINSIQNRQAVYEFSKQEAINEYNECMDAASGDPVLQQICYNTYHAEREDLCHDYNLAIQRDVENYEECAEECCVIE